MLLPDIRIYHRHPTPKLKFHKREYYDNIPFPSYSPNTVNQTVSMNGYTFKGNPGQGWSVQQTPQQQQAEQQQQQAQALFQAQQGSAVSGLQTQQTNLGQQYSDLLKTVNQQYQPLINQTQTQENNFLGQRGLLSDTGSGGNQMNQAMQGIYGQEAGNAQQIGQGSINDMNTLAQAIAQTQQSGAQFAANLPLQYGSLALQQQALPSTINLQNAQASNYNALGQAAKYIPIQSGENFLNASNGQAIPVLQALAKSMGFNITG